MGSAYTVVDHLRTDVPYVYVYAEIIPTYKAGLDMWARRAMAHPKFLQPLRTKHWPSNYNNYIFPGHATHKHNKHTLPIALSK